MRLIDADKLLRFFTVDTANQTYRFGTIKKQIENAKTVQAIPIPNNATNGDMIKAMFPSIKIREHEKTDICDAHIQIDIWDFTIYVSKYWWNVPYTEKRDNEND